jgi:hypothetical protein
VQHVTDTSLVVRVADKAARDRPRTVLRTKVARVSSGFDNSYRMHGPLEILPTLRAWGEPPGRGGPLVKVQEDVFAVSTAGRATCNEVSVADVTYLREGGCNDGVINEAIGNCVPPSMVCSLLTDLTTALYTPHTAQPFSKKAHVPQLVDDTHLGTQMILLIPVCAQHSKVFLSKEGVPLLVTVPAGRLTGRVTQQVKHLAQGRAVHLGGKCT